MTDALLIDQDKSQQKCSLYTVHVPLSSSQPTLTYASCRFAMWHYASVQAASFQAPLENAMFRLRCEDKVFF